MDKIKSLALLVGGGFATQAGAAVQVINLQASSTPADILIGAGAYTTGAPQFSWGQDSFGKAQLSAVNDSAFVAASGPMTLPDANSTVFANTGFKPSDTASDYAGVRFDIAGQTQYGIARFAPSPVADELPFLTRVQYRPALAAVPEPESWAMLIGGMGLAGLAARRRRKVAAVTA